MPSADTHLWLLFNPGCRFLRREKGRPIYVNPNGVFTIVGQSEKHIVGEDNLRNAIAGMSERAAGAGKEGR